MLVRPATAADRDAVLALGVGEEAAWFGEPEVSAGEVGEWIDEEGGLAGGVVAVGVDDRVCGFAAPGRHLPVFLADPDREDAVADALLPWLRERREVVEVSAYAGARAALFERHGLRHGRSSFSLVRPADAGPVPEASFPGDVDVARYRLGEDDAAVHRLIYVEAAWAAVPGHVERDLDAWRDLIRGARSCFLARRKGAAVGWVAGRVLDNGRGYVTTLAVATGARRRGLGRALLLHAFADLQRAGARELTLAVEAHNESALGLYRSVGMQVEREWRFYRG